MLTAYDDVSAGRQGSLGRLTLLFADWNGFLHFQGGYGAVDDVQEGHAIVPIHILSMNHCLTQGVRLEWYDSNIVT